MTTSTFNFAGLPSEIRALIIENTDPQTFPKILRVSWLFHDIGLDKTVYKNRLKNIFYKPGYAGDVSELKDKDVLRYGDYRGLKPEWQAKHELHDTIQELMPFITQVENLEKALLAELEVLEEKEPFTFSLPESALSNIENLFTVFKAALRQDEFVEDAFVNVSLWLKSAIVEYIDACLLLFSSQTPFTKPDFYKQKIFETLEKIKARYLYTQCCSFEMAAEATQIVLLDHDWRNWVLRHHGNGFFRGSEFYKIKDPQLLSRVMKRLTAFNDTESHNAFLKCIDQILTIGDEASSMAILKDPHLKKFTLWYRQGKLADKYPGAAQLLFQDEHFYIDIHQGLAIADKHPGWFKQFPCEDLDSGAIKCYPLLIIKSPEQSLLLNMEKDFDDLSTDTEIATFLKKIFGEENSPSFDKLLMHIFDIESYEETMENPEQPQTLVVDLTGINLEYLKSSVHRQCVQSGRMTLREMLSMNAADSEMLLESMTACEKDCLYAFTQMAYRLR